MSNYKTYLITTLGFVILFTALALFVTPFLVKNAMSRILSSEVAAAKIEAQHIASISGDMLSQGVTKNEVVRSIQKTITNTDAENLFISVLDWSGKIISYPDVTQVGSKSTDSDTTIASMETTISGEELYEYITNLNPQKEFSTLSDMVLMSPVPDSDLIIAAHINQKTVFREINDLRMLYNVSFLILGLLSLVFTLAVLRYVTSHYEELLSQKTSKIEDSVLNLSKLNTSLESYQRNLLEVKRAQETAPAVVAEETVMQTEKSKQRLLTYVRNELVSIPTEDIAYVYVDNTITYVIQKNGKRSTTNESLDQIFSHLDERFFFRANRQIIVAIHAIRKITKFGNSALKIQTDPDSEIEIVIGKNKAAAFKQWLDM